MTYDYSQPHYLVIGPDMAKVDPPDPSDIEQCKEVVREIARFNQERTGWFDLPDIRVLKIRLSIFDAAWVDVTAEWFNELFAEELAEQRRSYTRSEHEANRADAERHTV